MQNSEFQGRKCPITEAYARWGEDTAGTVGKAEK